MNLVRPTRTHPEQAHPEETRRGKGIAAQGRLLLAVLSLSAAAILVLHGPSANRVAMERPRTVSSPLVATAAPSTHSARSVEARNLISGLPLTFEPNQGQANLSPSDPRARFISRGPGYSLFLGAQGAILGLVSQSQGRAHNSKQHAVTRASFLRMKLAGANPNATLVGAEPLPGVSNYFLGNDPNLWRRSIPQFAAVRYENVYPGVNLLFYGNQGHLEYDFQVAAGADPSAAELEFDGASHLRLNDGALVVETSGGRSIRLEAPTVYQQMDGRRQQIAGSFVLRGANRAGFAIGPYDRSRELVIDPLLSFSTYFGGSGDEHNTYVAVDDSGNIFLSGSTTSPNLPVAAPGAFTDIFQTALAGPQNVYVAEITPPRGSNPAALQYVTYLGGNGTDSPVGVGVDGADNAYVAGTTSSTNFPTSTDPYQKVPEASSTGTQHVFVTVLTEPTAQVPQILQYSSYLSGSGNDIASGMTIDAKGGLFVTGTTTSIETSTTDQFPATQVPQPVPYQNFSKDPGVPQFFVTWVKTTTGSFGSIAYSTYFGGGTANAAPIVTGGGVAVDTNDNIYFSGTTNFIYTGTAQNTDFPILDAYQPCLDQLPPVTIINPPTCTNSGNTAPDAFFAKINPLGGQGEQLIWSSYFGGANNDSSTGIALDPGAAYVFITGTTNSPNITPATITFSSYQECLDAPNPPVGTPCPTTFATTPPPTDAYVARFGNLAPTATDQNLALAYFSYLGGSGNDEGLALTVDASEGAVMTGWTQSIDFPVAPSPNNIQSKLAGAQNAFIARLNGAALTGSSTVASWSNYFGGTGTDEGTGVTIDTNGAIYFAGDTNSPPPNFPVDKPLPPTEGGGYGGGYDAFVAQLGSASSLSIVGNLVTGPDQSYISGGNEATFNYILTNSGPDLATNVVLTDNLQNTGIPVVFNNATTSSGTCSTGTGGTSAVVSCNIPALQAASTAQITINLTPQASASGNPALFTGGSVTAIGANNITPAETSVNANMSDFTVSITPPNFAVPAAGDTATYQVTLFPHPVYGNQISLAVTGLPTGAGANFTTTSVTLPSSSPVTTYLNITTTVRPIPVPQASLFRRHFYAFWLPVPGLALIGFAAAGDRRRKRWAGLLMLCFVFATLALQPACHGTTQQTPASGTPAGNYYLTLTARSGSDSKSAYFELTVP